MKDEFKMAKLRDVGRLYIVCWTSCYGLLYSR